MRQMWLALALCLCTACGSDLTPAWEVIEPRLFGARIEVDSDPARSRPGAGESFTLRQYLVLPKSLGAPSAERYGMSLALCLGFKTPNGQLACAGDITLTPRVTVQSETEILVQGLAVPSLDSVLPAGVDQAFGEVDRLALFGVVCVDGTAERVPDKSIDEDPPSQLFRCTGNAASEFPYALSFTLSVLLDLGRLGDLNHNPSFSCDPSMLESVCNVGLEVEGERTIPGPFVLVMPELESAAEPPRQPVSWEAYPGGEAALPWTNCAADPGLAQVRAESGEHQIRIRFDPSDREQFMYEVEENGELVTESQREELLISHALTEFGGSLERHFSVVEREVDDVQAEMDVTYTPPDQSETPEEHIPDTGRLVRFYFGLRDGRGGVDFATRELCLLPPIQE